MAIKSGVAAGDVVKYHVSEWRQADKDTEGFTSNMLGVALAAGGLGEGPVLVRGVVRLAAGHISDTGGTNGDPLYVGDDGHVTFAPSATTGDFVRVVGYCLNEDDDIIYFNPGTTWIEVS